VPALQWLAFLVLTHGGALRVAQEFISSEFDLRKPDTFARVVLQPWGDGSEARGSARVLQEKVRSRQQDVRCRSSGSATGTPAALVPSSWHTTWMWWRCTSPSSWRSGQIASFVP
jgi:hypothetical protein